MFRLMTNLMAPRVMQAYDLLDGKPLYLRSARWPTVRDKFLKQHPFCAICGFTKNLNIHHIVPFHIDTQLELAEVNLITLGEKCPTGNHHLLFGHLGDWKSWNVNVVTDAAAILQKIQHRPYGQAQ